MSVENDKSTDPSPKKRELLKKKTTIDVAEVPDIQNWNDYKTYRACQLPDQEKTKLHVGDSIYIRPGIPYEAPKRGKKVKGSKKQTVTIPDDVGDLEKWIGRIEQIRAVNKVDVYIKITWYYTQDQLQSSGFKYAKQLQLEGGEVVHSDHFEIIPVSTCEDKATVINYDECAEDQIQIAPDDWFVRYRTVELMGADQSSEKSKDFKSRKKPHVQKPAELNYKPGCICGKMYYPLPFAKESRMHYCPREKCKTWYHSTCLASSGRDRVAEDAVHFETNHAQPTEDGEAGDASADETEVEPSSSNHPSKKLKSNGDGTSAESSSAVGGGDGSSKSHPVYPATLVSMLPPALLRIARQPIVRGTSTSGIVGTCVFVLAARRILRDVCEFEGTLPEDWKVVCGLPEVEGEEGGLKLKTAEELADEAEEREEEREKALKNSQEGKNGVEQSKKRKNGEDAVTDEDGLLGGPDGEFVFACPRCENLI
ncbi:Zinc finger, RING/FYVE/PHD-type [Phaffia rhodozyma]|uniref:Zinc finger, RING/FYVE/PHD-type n=1 Tax=Phaffia rhodozyma TaxID=264483 RepID=A0A0F7SJT7_PHARH|nr:Zinc finger, RING/FYVE/PHD-type [Phaffia rhodozyma]